VNFIDDVIEQFPFSREAVIEIDSEGRRHVHHFSELFARSLGLSGAMLAQGVRRGDVVMTLIGNRVEWVIAMLACFRMGAVALPCNSQLRPKDLAYRVQVANPKLAIGEPELLASLPDGIPYFDLDDLQRIFDEDLPQETPSAAVQLDPGDPALIVFTSGTTGDPRAALHSQRYLLGQELQARNWLAAKPGELVWCTAATGWSKSSRNSFIAPWLCGAKALLHHGRFDPEERLDIVDREGVNVLCQAPTEYRMLARRTELRPLPSVRRMVSAGEALNAEVIDAFRQVTGLRIGDGYGQTETGAVTGVLPEDPVTGYDGTMGRPLPGIEVRVGDEEPGSKGEALGELFLKVSSSPTFFAHYLGGEPFEEEWWPTGDLVRRDADGFLYHEGRNDDIISSSGYRIGPVEVESALISHPAVAEAAAVGAPDPERGEVVRAVVVLRDEALRGLPADDPRLKSLAAELQEHCKRVTAPYKFPRIVEFTDELPKTASGKIRRAYLRAQTA
jgi:acyl-coenzyme A synthetase/AMP-(fatty) acid ligase